MWLLSLLWGCNSDHLLTKENVAEIEYVYVQDNWIEGERIEDTGISEPIWVDSFTQPKVSNGVDILWVIDGSGSMNDDQNKILQGINDMLLNLPTYNWRLMILSMSRTESADNTSFPLLPGDSYDDAVAMLLQNVTHNQEKGFDSVYEYITYNIFAHQWMRPDAALLIVYVSDEDDSSNYHHITVDQHYDWLLHLRNQVHVSAIVTVDPAESQCPNSNFNDMGKKYIELSDLFSGQVIDLCSSDWSQGVAAASSGLALHEYHDLSNIPADPNAIYVFVDGQPFYDFHYVEVENRVYFDVIPPEESLVEIAYYY
jgi:hypothetical protein